MVALLIVLAVGAGGLILAMSGRLPSVGPVPTVNLATSPVEATRQFWRAAGTPAVADFMAGDYPMREVALGVFVDPGAAPESISIVGVPVESGPVAFVTTEVCTSAGGSRGLGRVVVELHKQDDGSWLVANMLVSVPYEPVLTCP